MENKNNILNFALLGASMLPMGRAIKAGSGILGYALRKLAHNQAKYAGSRLSQNVPNLIEGFYSGQKGAKVAGMGKALGTGLSNTAKQALSLDASKASRFGGISKMTYDVNNNNVKAIHHILKDPKNWDLRKGKYGKLKSKPAATVKQLSKQIQGQNNTQIGINHRYDNDIGVMSDLQGAHFYGVGKIGSKNISKKIFKSDKAVIDDVKAAWGMNKPGMPVKVAYQKATKLTASHHDAQMNKSFVNISNAFHLKKARTVDDFKTAFRGKKTGIGQVKKIDKDNIMFEYSPDRRSDLYKGGFNVRAVLDTKKGTVNFNISDEFDIGGNALKFATERGMDYRLLNVMKSKTIKVPEIGKTVKKGNKKVKGYFEGKSIAEKEASKAVERVTRPRDMKTMTDPTTGRQALDEILSSPQLRTNVPIANKELGYISNMMRDVDDIAKGYKSYNPYFYGTRVGLPIAAAGGTAGLIGYTLSDD